MVLSIVVYWPLTRFSILMSLAVATMSLLRMASNSKPHGKHSNDLGLMAVGFLRFLVPASKFMTISLEVANVMACRLLSITIHPICCLNSKSNDYTHFIALISHNLMVCLSSLVATMGDYSTHYIAVMMDVCPSNYPTKSPSLYFLCN